VTANWQTVPMGELCSIQSGKSDTKDAVDDGPYAFFDRSKSIKRSSRFLRDCEALIIPGEGAEFLPRHFVGKFDLHQRAYALFDFSPRIEVTFLYYYLHHVADYFSRVAVGATVKSLRLRHFEQLPVRLTDTATQRRIVAILNEAFEGIAVVKANVQRNLRSARELLESKLLSLLDHDAAGWPRKTLREVSIDFGRGKSKHRPRNDPKLHGGPYPFIQTGDVRGAKHLITDFTQTYSEEGLAQSKLWPRGTLCITIAANIAETGVIDFEACFPDSIVGVVVDENQTSSKYLEYMLHTVKADLKAKGKGSAQDNINLATFENERFPFPELYSQAHIVGLLDDLSAEVEHIEGLYDRKLTALEELKKSLLRQAFDGRLRRVT
jgi:type I restriction enzyme, S subunit